MAVPAHETGLPHFLRRRCEEHHVRSYGPSSPRTHISDALLDRAWAFFYVYLRRYGS
jgi:hypothetical protein